MKKIVALAISLILLVCGIVFQGNEEAGNVNIKLGNKKSEKVTSVNTLAEVLDSITSRLQFGYMASTEEHKIEGMEGDNWFDDILGGSDEKVEYTDAVLTFDTYGTMGVDIEGDSFYKTYSSNMTFDRSMTCYFTEDSAYYSIDAEIRSSASYNDGNNSESSKSFTSMKAELYLTEDVALMRFSEIIILAEGFDTDLKELVGKWIDCSEGGSEMLYEMNSQNYEQLSLIGDCVENHESEGFKKNGSVYTLKDAFCKELCLQLFAIAGAGSIPEEYVESCGFKVDLSDSTMPVMDLSYVIESDKNDKDNKISGIESTRITVSDINRGNTVRIPESADIYDISDFEELF